MIEGKIDKIQIWNNMIEASKLIISLMPIKMV